MILTVALNPALDVTYRVDVLVPGETHRVREVNECAGGKGLNVARVLHALKEPVVATGLIGGATGTRIASLLATPVSFMEIAGDSRRTVVVADEADATGFWEPGPEVAGREWDAFLAHYTGLAADAQVVVLSGSLPRGLPADAYALLVDAAPHALTVLDADGPPLREALAARPTLVKPNAAELSPGRIARSEADRRAGIDRMRAAGANAVVASFGAEGVLAAGPAGAWRVAPPERVAGNPTGAGDACVAALARGLSHETPWPEMLTDAVALSAAAVATPVAGVYDEPTYRRLRDAVRAEEI